MVKRTGKRILSLLMAAALMLSLLPMVGITALAASGTVSTSVEGLGASYKNDANMGRATGNGMAIRCIAEGYTDTIIWFIKEPKSSTTTLTLTNNKQNAAKLTFDYSFTTSTSGGSCTIDNTDVTNGEFKKTLNSGESVSVAVTSPKGEGTTSTLQITNISLVEQKNVTLTFEPAQNGSYTVDDEIEITSQTQVMKDSTEGFAVKAVPVSGYKFMGWYSETYDTYLSTSAETVLLVENDQTVVAKFIPSTTALFQVSAYVFDNLNLANEYAKRVGATQITVISSGEIPAGEYTISSGNTLLIPFDDAGTCYTTEPGAVKDYADQKEFRRLTINENANILVDGTVSVSAKIRAAGGSDGRGPTVGAYGRIEMAEGSSMTVSSTGSLYVYGYITGSGTITANPGANVHEVFELQEFRGGTITSMMVLAYSSKKVFPLSQYYIQNIEAPMMIHSGAFLRAHSALYVSNQIYTAEVTVIGQTEGLFRLKSGTLTKRYLPGQDRCQIDINGTADLAAVSLELGGTTVDSKNFVMPINGQFDIRVCSGTTTITENIELLPGAELFVDSGATLEIINGKSMHIYDSDEWNKGNYVFNGKKMAAASYSPTRKYTRSNNDLTDVVVDVNGVLNVIGNLYTTESGADIISSQGTGNIVFVNGAGENTTINQVASQSSFTAEFDSINVTSAKLHNGERYAGTEYEYTETVGATGGTTYFYCSGCDKWYTGEQHSHAARIVNGDKEGAYETLTEALALYDAGTKAEEAANDSNLPYIQMENNTSESSLIIDEPVYLDLNGKTVDLSNGGLTIAEGGALYGMDSATEDYSDARYGKIVGTVSGTGKVAVAHGTYRLAGGKVRRYVSYQNGDELSFHRYNMSVTKYEFHFRPNGQCDMDFGATFRGSPTVVQLLKDMGFKVEKTGTDDSAQGWWSTENGGLPKDLPSGYVLRGTLINIGSNELAEFTQDYDIYALLKFQDDTVVESVPRNLNYLWALKKYYLSDEATAEKQAIIYQFVKDKNLTEAWNKIQIQ